MHSDEIWLCNIEMLPETVVALRLITANACCLLLCENTILYVTQ
jgi:hypothetical protein